MDDFRDWEWSSYHALVGTGKTKLKRDEVLNMFGGVKGFEEFHQTKMDEKKIKKNLAKLLGAFDSDESEAEEQKMRTQSTIMTYESSSKKLSDTNLMPVEEDEYSSSASATVDQIGRAHV